jgi:flagellar biogenesis protein FliO
MNDESTFFGMQSECLTAGNRMNEKTTRSALVQVVGCAMAMILSLAFASNLAAQSTTTDDRSTETSPKAEKENADSNSSLPLLPPKADPTGKDKKGSNPQSPITLLGSLALVLGIFFLIVWFLRKTSPNAFGALPPEAFEVLGRAPLAFRQQAMMLRCGNKVLLISTGMAGTKRLTEITDSAEVERLTELCRRAKPAGAKALFQNVFRQKEARHE